MAYTWESTSRPCTSQRWVRYFFEILSDLNQAVPNHLADESQTRWPDTPPDHPHHRRMVRWCIRLTRLNLVCEVVRYRLVQVRQNLKKRLFGLAARNCLSLFSSSFILSFVLLPFFLNTKMKLGKVTRSFRKTIFSDGEVDLTNHYGKKKQGKHFSFLLFHVSLPEQFSFNHLHSFPDLAV